DATAGEWTTEWLQTNQIPKMVRFLLGTGQRMDASGQPMNFQVATVEIPSQAVPIDLVGGGPRMAGNTGTNQPGPGSNVPGGGGNPRGPGRGGGNSGSGGINDGFGGDSGSFGPGTGGRGPGNRGGGGTGGGRGGGGGGGLPGPR
ncbi:MAG: hypothetical protein ACKVYV_04720, partial [Limisphaerales bacterium]